MKRRLHRRSLSLAASPSRRCGVVGARRKSLGAKRAVAAPACRPSRRHAAGRRCRAISTAKPAPDTFSPAVAGALPRVYVPNVQLERRLRDRSGDFKVVDRFKVGAQSAARRAVVGPAARSGSPTTPRAAPTARSRRSTRRPASPARPIPVRRSYNMYFTPDGTLGDRGGGGAHAARLPRSAHDGAAVVAADARSATASTTPTSRSTAATRSSPASSTAGWSRSTSVNRKVLGYLQLVQAAACRRTSASRRTARCSTWPT